MVWPGVLGVHMRARDCEAALNVIRSLAVSARARHALVIACATTAAFDGSEHCRILAFDRVLASPVDMGKLRQLASIALPRIDRTIAGLDGAGRRVCLQPLCRVVPIHTPMSGLCDELQRRQIKKCDRALFDTNDFLGF